MIVPQQFDYYSQADIMHTTPTQAFRPATSLSPTALMLSSKSLALPAVHLVLELGLAALPGNPM